MCGIESLIRKGRKHLLRMDDAKLPKAGFYSVLSTGKKMCAGTSTATGAKKMS